MRDLLPPTKMPENSIDARIESTIGHFSVIYLGGIPPIITNDSAFLSFLNVLSAIEALAGFRYANTIRENGERFQAFVRSYFPDAYKPLAKRMWLFRCRMLHAFSPVGFGLTHHHSENHFKIEHDTGDPTLNAEDFYAALLTAAQAYFADLRGDPQLGRLLIARLDDPKSGGSIAVRAVRLKSATSSRGRKRR